MQRSWREDEDKCTFIVMDSATRLELISHKTDATSLHSHKTDASSLHSHKTDATSLHSHKTDESSELHSHKTDASSESIKSCVGGSHQCDLSAMIGDVNVFLQLDDEGMRVGELEVMIAEPSFRGCGRGKEALLLLIKYAVDSLKVDKLVAKIGFSNAASISLFTKLGFVEVGRSEVFEEITFSVDASQDWMATIDSKIGQYDVITI